MKTAKLLAKVLVSLGLLAFLAWRTYWDEVAAALARFQPAFWLAALGLYLGLQLLSGFRWRILAEPLGFHRPISAYLRWYFIGMFFNLFLPTSVGGDVVRAWYLDGRSGRRLPALVSVVVDRLSGLAVLLALAVAAALVYPHELPGWVRGCVWGSIGLAALGVAGVLLLLPRSPLGEGEEPSGLRKLQLALQGLQASLRSRPGAMAAATLFSLLVQAGNVLLVWLVGRSIGAPVPGLYWWIVVPMVSLLTMLPITYAGMGVREAAMVRFLAPLGVASSTALTLAFLWFAIFTTAGLAGGVVYLLNGFFKVPDHASVRGDSGQGRAGQPRAAA